MSGCLVLAGRDRDRGPSFARAPGSCPGLPWLPGWASFMASRCVVSAEARVPHKPTVEPNGEAPPLATSPAWLQCVGSPSVGGLSGKVCKAYEEIQWGIRAPPTPGQLTLRDNLVTWLRRQRRQEMERWWVEAVPFRKASETILPTAPAV